ncbi:hypothetical protein WJX75_004528 [Coccomyxa subellipsoidea]|uniref:BZIP domain-containing protein n=1 Tax=Coccomyxa subellipsoidea TaxID=248742 RepID=A0ABR2YPS1_9CHLO
MFSSADEQARNSGDDSKRPPSERRRTRNRSEREQNMNKLAQVRYRERKKAKAVELQAAIQALSERMQELTTAQQRNAELRRRNAELQQALTQQMAPDNPSLLAAQSVTGPGLQLPVDRTGSPAEGTDEDGPAADEEEKHLLSHQQERLHDLVLLLKDGIKGMSGFSGKKQEACSSSAFTQMVSEAVHCFVSVGCHKGAQSFGQPGTTPMRDMRMQSHIWESAVRQIQVTSDQLLRILQIRNEYATKLDAIAQQRSKLNAEAIAIFSSQV